MDLVATSVDLAKGTIQQVLTLSTAVVALSVTFSKDVLRTSVRWQLWCLYAAWVCELVSLVAGVFALKCLAGNAALGVANIYAENVKFFAIGQDLGFVIGVALLVIHAIAATLVKSDERTS